MSKVTRAEIVPPYEPITIVLETEREAALVWHRLNCNGDLSKYCEERGITKASLECGKLWTQLNTVFTPKPRGE